VVGPVTVRHLDAARGMQLGSVGCSAKAAPGDSTLVAESAVESSADDDRSAGARRTGSSVGVGPDIDGVLSEHGGGLGRPPCSRL